MSDNCTFIQEKDSCDTGVEDVNGDGIRMDSDETDETQVKKLIVKLC